MRINPQPDNDGLEDHQSHGVTVRRRDAVQVVDLIDIVNGEPNVQAVVDHIPDHHKGKHGNVVESSSQQCHNGHDETDRADDNVACRVGSQNRFGFVVVHIVDSRNASGGDGQDERDGGGANEDDGNDNDGSAVIAAASACIFRIRAERQENDKVSTTFRRDRSSQTLNIIRTALGSLLFLLVHGHATGAGRNSHGLDRLNGGEAGDGHGPGGLLDIGRGSFFHFLDGGGHDGLLEFVVFVELNLLL